MEGRGRKLGVAPLRAYPETVAFMGEVMDGIIYIVGLIVIIMFILSFLGLR